MNEYMKLIQTLDKATRELQLKYAENIIEDLESDCYLLFFEKAKTMEKYCTDLEKIRSILLDIHHSVDKRE